MNLIEYSWVFQTGTWADLILFTWPIGTSIWRAKIKRFIITTNFVSHLFRRLYKFVIVKWIIHSSWARQLAWIQCFLTLAVIFYHTGAWLLNWFIWHLFCVKRFRIGVIVLVLVLIWEIARVMHWFLPLVSVWLPWFLSNRLEIMTASIITWVDSFLVHWITSLAVVKFRHQW